MTQFRLRSIALVAYGPTVVASIGYGSVAPLVALRARGLGADIQTAALIVAMLGIGSLCASLPAGAVVARIGEPRTLLLCGIGDAVAMTWASRTTSLVGLALAIVLSGMTWTAFLLARQGYMIEVVPPSHRARALSMLGGTHRIGVLVGPLVAALIVHRSGLGAVFLFAATMSLTSGILAMWMPDVGAQERASTAAGGHASVRTVLREHRRVLGTLGASVIIIGASRSLRMSLLPLWADHIGLSASTTSLIFALAGAVDIAFFFPGGWLMDHRGRAIVAIPVVGAVAIACLVLPLATTAWAVAAVMVVITIGNGLGSGIVMTLGADTAPVVGRSQYLGGWRLCGDLGNTGGPLLVSALAALAPLAVTSVLLAGILGLGTLWVGHWTRDLDRRAAPRIS